MSKLRNYIELQNEYKDLEEKLKRAQEEFEKTIPLKKCKERYYYIDDRDRILDTEWFCSVVDVKRYNCGNVFKEMKQAENELLKRNLIANIEHFRKECYGNWQPDWNDLEEHKYSIINDGNYFCTHKIEIDTFNMFGYFKYEEECRKAIELFGDDLETWLLNGKR